MIQYRAVISTLLDREQAFSDLSRFDRAADWDPGVESGAMLTPDPVGMGSRFLLHARFLGRTLPLEYEIAQFEPGRRLVLRAENANVVSIDTISFDTPSSDTPSCEPAAGNSATVVTYDARLQVKGIGRLFEPLLALAFRRIGDRAADGLRRHLGSVRP